MASHACRLSRFGAACWPPHAGWSLGAFDLPATQPQTTPLRLPPARSWVRDAPASLGYQWGAPLPVWVRFARWQAVMFMPPPPRDDGNATSPAAAAGHEGGGSGLGDGGSVRPGSALSNRTKAYNDTLVPLLMWDVATDTHVLDPALRYPSARNASATSSSTSPPGPREGLLTDGDFSRDGAAYARVLWHWARAMALAGQVAALKEGNGTASPPPPPPPTPPGVALSQTDLDAIRVQQEHAAQAGQGAGAESARLQKAFQELADRVVALGRAVRELPEDVALPPGQGLGVYVLGYRLVADVLEQVGGRGWGNKVLVTRGGGSGSRRKRVRSGEIRPTEVAVRLWLQLPQRAPAGWPARRLHVVKVA